MQKIKSTKFINASILKREDNRLAIVFSLLDKKLEELFFVFCNDIIESGKNLSIIQPLFFITERWKSWISMFRNPQSIMLNINEIRGLLGELIFLKEFMIPKYGEEEALNSWIGNEKAHKDFEIENTWYELKCIKEEAVSVKISSISQLESSIEGELVMVKLEESNSSISNPFSLNNYVEKISKELKSKEQINKFENKLIKAKYLYNEFYDAFIYALKGVEHYLVDEKFPRFKKGDLPEGIIKVSYELYITKIEKFRIKDVK